MSLLNHVTFESKYWQGDLGGAIRESQSKSNKIARHENLIDLVKQEDLNVESSAKQVILQPLVMQPLKFGNG